MPMFLLVIILCAISFFAGVITMIAFDAYIRTLMETPEQKPETPSTQTFKPDILYYND